ncbi:MAG: hypothetical protein M0R80_26045 [Proteobacteria bacterium]|nr:hypothetical protein [Pseudomonadota bacterium]
MTEGQPLYTAHNIWYERADRVFAINYKKGIIIPAGSPAILDPRGVRRGDSEIRFSVPAAGVSVTMHLQPKFAPGVSIEALRDRTLTPKPWEQIIEGLDAKEIECIRNAVVQPGVSKRAVLAAYGYPPEHVTPTLEKGVWTYWINRFIKKELVFGADGRTTTALP